MPLRFSSPRPRPFLLVQMFIAVALANLNPVFAKILFDKGWEPVQLYFAVLMIVVGVLLLHEFIALDRGERWGMTKEDVTGTALTAFFGGVLSPLLFYHGLKHVTASESIIITSILPFFVVVLAVFFLKEKFHWRGVLGGFLLTVGLAVSQWSNLQSFQISIGILLILCGTFASGLTVIVHKKFVKHRHLDSVILVRNAISLAMVAVWIFLFEPDGFSFLFMEQNIWLFLLLPVCSFILPFFLYFRALKKLTATDAGTMEAAGRVLAMVAAAAILGEAIRLEYWVSIFIIIVGLLIVNIPLTRWRITPSRLVGIGPLRK